MIRHSPCQTRGCALELHQLFIFYKHFFDDILCISTKMTLCITVKFRRDDRFAVFNDNMCRCHFGKIGLPDIGGIADRYRDDRTFCPGCDLKASVMEWQHIQLIGIFVSGSLGEDADRNAGFYIVGSLEDGFKSLFDIFPVKEETVEIAHPVGEQRIMLHFLLGNIAGADRTAAVGEQDVEIAPVVCYIEFIATIGFSSYNIKIPSYCGTLRKYL